MKCPTCNHHDQQQIDLHSRSFHEGILECNSCHTVWSLNHGLTGVISDPFEASFLAASTEAVEGNVSCWAT